MDQTEYILETDFNYTHVKFCLSISVRIRGVLGVLLDPFCLHWELEITAATWVNLQNSAYDNCSYVIRSEKRLLQTAGSSKLNFPLGQTKPGRAVYCH